jgi:hypothetical protein
MWWAYRQHGILPRAGGYLDQPAAWWDTVRVLNIWYSTIVDEVREEAKEEKSMRGLFGSGGVNMSWDELRRD